MTTATPNYGGAADLTLTLTSLASDTNLVAGRESTAISNITDDCIDSVVQMAFTTVSNPTASRQGEWWSYGSVDGSTYSGGATGTDANLTPQEKTTMRLLTIVPTGSGANQLYRAGVFSIAQAHGGTMPRNWGLYMVQNTGVALNATASNHKSTYNPVKYESA